MNRKRWTLLACLMAVAITCLTLIAGAQDGQRKFSDVPDVHRNADAIQQASSRGWINGYPDGTFRPGELITPGQISTVIDRIINNDYPDGMTRGQFAELITDNTLPAWFPNLNWGNPISCNEAIGRNSGLAKFDWCIFLPVSRQDIAIRWLVVSINWSEYYRSGNEQISDRPELVMERFYNNEWTYPGHPGLFIPIGSITIPTLNGIIIPGFGSFEDPVNPIFVTVQYYNHTTYQYIQVRNIVYAGSDDCPKGWLACWNTEIEICYSDVNTIGGKLGECWADLNSNRTFGGQKWPFRKQNGAEQ